MLLQWSQSACRDRLSIIEYIARDNPAAARSVSTAFRDAAYGLLNFPHKGKVGRVAGTRELSKLCHKMKIETIS
ncbi:type II toxin-antitoxin system RelE/ParE family toxin [Desulfovibrio sp. OH1186_COT-070]|uniref:type II toxin-antitoxin system RelE/ParE family toxin n=1 Tax=unclassified Desulfovibrio TaxID=2593640 RepID=UPI000F5E112D|nr:type II toxin-antitoxin system RelE/ParE family toxin [Desulfovibrio sp. OH1209_COT-279]RRD85472.1 type II toxin-antitoxin system RelE/ParE family toxin [Desulfovibrio sp. OH1186_COT-070]